MSAPRDVIAACQPECLDHATPARPSADRLHQADVALMQQIAEGDREAFERLYQRYATRLTGYLARRLAAPDLVDEVLNDVMLVVWQRASTFQAASRVSTWLLGIARHKACHAQQRHLRQSTLPPGPLQPWHKPDDPATSLQGQEWEQTVAWALTLLPAEQREVVKLTYYHALSSPEIAQRLRVSVHTVRSRLKLARRRLASLLTRVSVAPTDCVGDTTAHDTGATFQIDETVRAAGAYESPPHRAWWPGKGQRHESK